MTRGTTRTKYWIAYVEHEQEWTWSSLLKASAGFEAIALFIRGMDLAWAPQGEAAHRQIHDSLIG